MTVVCAGDAWIGGSFAFVAFVSSTTAAFVRAVNLDTFGIVLTSVPAAPVDVDTARATGSRNNTSYVGAALFNVIRMHGFVVASTVGEAASACTLEFASQYGAVS